MEGNHLLGNLLRQEIERGTSGDGAISGGVQM
jgi:hypothetical protein